MISINYTPRTALFFDGKGEASITKTQLYDLNNKRGEVLMNLLNRKSDEGERFFDLMAKNKPDDFAKNMLAANRMALTIAKVRMFVLSEAENKAMSDMDVWNEMRQSLRKEKDQDEEKIKIY